MVEVAKLAEQSVAHSVSSRISVQGVVNRKNCMQIAVPTYQKDF